MRLNFPKYFILVLLSLIVFPVEYAVAQSPGNQQFNLREVKIEDGLSQSTVNCILQDRKGYLWFGTANGLNRYDGYNFLVSANDPADTTSISSNGILSICEDKEGFIWVGTTDGILNRYDRKTGTFKHYDITSRIKVEYDSDEMFYDFPLPLSRNNEKSITAIAQDKNGFLWIGTWGSGLIRFDPRSNSIKSFCYEKKNPYGFHTNRVKAILPDTDGSVWVATLGAGLYKFTAENKNIKFIRYEHTQNSWSLKDNKLFSLFKDSNGDLWIGTYGSGVVKLSKQEQLASPQYAKFQDVVDNSPLSQTLSHETVSSFFEDENKNIWIGSFGGITRFNLRNKHYLGFEHDPEIEKTLSKDDVFSLLQDRSGTIWIGTHLGKGLRNLERSTLKFKLLKKNANGKSRLNDDVVWALCQDENSNLWIGTYRGGLNLLNRKTGKFSYYKYNAAYPNSISDNHIRAIVDDKKGSLWIGTYKGGLNIFNKASRSFRRIINIPNDATSLGANQVQTILIDRDKNYWIGTFGGGLNKLTKEDFAAGKIQFKKYIQDKNNPFSISDDRIYALFQDKDGIIWIGTFGGGINKFDPKTEQFISYKNILGDESSLSDNRVMSIYEDVDGFLWIGTYGGGLQKFDKRREKFVRFGKRNRMNSSVVYGILADGRNNLWMSTDNGLFKLNRSTETFSQYDLHDGLQSLEFSGGAYFKSAAGEMFFGGINGLNYFFPDSIRDNSKIPPVVVSSVRIFNEPIKGEQEKIKLSYWQNFFSFEFSALDYISPQDNHYAYMLEGFDNEWHYVDSRRRIANYTNLSPGEYIFHVRGSNNDGLWNDEGAKIYLTILPPFWKTWWFISLTGTFVIIMIFYLSTIRYRNLLAIEKIKSRLAADLHDNIGSGLTEISILSELISNEIKEPPKNLNLISEKARILIDTMSDIVWMVNPKRDTFYHFILRLKDSYVDVLNSSGISFKTVNVEKFDKLKLPMEYKQNLYLIFKEGINNAVKHSGCKKIILEANIIKDVVEILLKDDGCGIDEAHITYGNGLINMKSRARFIGGQLVIDSSSNGTTIIYRGKVGGFKKLLFSFIK